MNFSRFIHTISFSFLLFLGLFYSSLAGAAWWEFTDTTREAPTENTDPIDMDVTEPTETVAEETMEPIATEPLDPGDTTDPIATDMPDPNLDEPIETTIPAPTCDTGNEETCTVCEDGSCLDFSSGSGLGGDEYCEVPMETDMPDPASGEFMTKGAQTFATTMSEAKAIDENTTGGGKKCSDWLAGLPASTIAIGFFNIAKLKADACAIQKDATDSTDSLFPGYKYDRGLKDAIRHCAGTFSLAVMTGKDKTDAVLTVLACRECSGTPPKPKDGDLSVMDLDNNKIGGDLAKLTDPALGSKTMGEIVTAGILACVQAAKAGKLTILEPNQCGANDAARINELLDPANTEIEKLH
ncbi:MAG: hypothetical protein KDD51_09775 [Bdellovibrionales bacterium]|nr:hypothetical protein [Bdellovibrionales bacterium]